MSAADLGFNCEAIRVGVYRRLCLLISESPVPTYRVELSKIGVDVEYLAETEPAKPGAKKHPALVVTWESTVGTFRWNRFTWALIRDDAELYGPIAEGLYEQLCHKVLDVFSGAWKDMLQTWRT